MKQDPDVSKALATAITRSASKHTYYTIRYFVDRDRTADAYRAYGYFRWVDNILDSNEGTQPEKIAFANRQQSLIDASYQGETQEDLCTEEQILIDLVHSDPETNSGLQTYLRNMMGVMIFDARRRYQVITQVELSEYSHMLATAVTEALLYFIGHGEVKGCLEFRYSAVTAAHIIHLLRDTIVDVQAGYFNIPQEYLQTHEISPHDVNSPAYREWVQDRIQMAESYFTTGRDFLAQIKNLRCRLAGYAYLSRFEEMMHVIERDRYTLRPEYPEKNGLGVGFSMGWSILANAFRPGSK